jgi:hypothetical protein
VPLQIQKSAAKNCVGFDLEIDSQKTLFAADSKIGSQLCRYRFRNQQRWWSHFGCSSLFFWVFT